LSPMPIVLLPITDAITRRYGTRYKSITSIRRRPQFSLQRVASVVQTHLAVPEASRARV
jgi:hypothetical protein